MSHARSASANDEPTRTSALRGYPPRDGYAARASHREAVNKPGAASGPQRLQLDDPAPDRDRHRLRPVVRPELVHDVLDVHLHRLLRDEEPVRDVFVAV